MANEENLNPFKPGVSGNPAGKPKGAKNRSTVLKELYAMMIEGQKLDGTKEKMSVEQAVMHALINKMMAGDVAAIKEGQDTVYGKVADKIDTTHSFTAMGRVKVGEDKALDFDVGEAPKLPE